MPAKAIIQHRRDTSANWSATNPVLSTGELGYDTTTKQFKIGDGTTAWNSLSFYASETTFTANRALVSDGSGKVSASTVSATEIGYLDNVTSDVQAQLNGKAASSHTHGMADLTAFEVTTPVPGQTLEYNGTRWVNTTPSSSGLPDVLMMMGA